jgi:hypothetical protein
MKKKSNDGNTISWQPGTTEVAENGIFSFKHYSYRDGVSSEQRCMNG